MSEGVRVQVQDLATPKMKRLLKKTKDMRPVFRGPINRSVTRFFTKQFATQGAHGRQVWAPNSPLTQKLKGRAGHGRAGVGQVGQDLRTLWASLTKSPAPQGVLDISAQEYRRGSLVAHARRFHSGYTARTIFGHNRKAPAVVPPRPLITDPVPGFLLREWQTDMAKFLEGSA